MAAGSFKLISHQLQAPWKKNLALPTSTLKIPGLTHYELGSHAILNQYKNQGNVVRLVRLRLCTQPLCIYIRKWCYPKNHSAKLKSLLPGGKFVPRSQQVRCPFYWCQPYVLGGSPQLAHGQWSFLAQRLILIIVFLARLFHLPSPAPSLVFLLHHPSSEGSATSRLQHRDSVCIFNLDVNLAHSPAHISQPQSPRAHTTPPSPTSTGAE